MDQLLKKDGVGDLVVQHMTSTGFTKKTAFSQFMLMGTHTG